MDPSTVVVTAGRGAKAPGDPVNVAVELSSTYRDGGPVIYGRESNPTWVAFEETVGALILGRPLPLARALERLDAMARRIPMQVAPAAAPLAQVNPLAAHGGGVAKLFSTHPPTAERVARLEAMAAGR